MSFDVNNSAYDEGRSGRLSYPSNGDTAAYSRGQYASGRSSSGGWSSTSTYDAEQAAALFGLIWLLLKAGTWLAVFTLAIVLQTVLLLVQVAFYAAAQLRRFRSRRLRHFVSCWVSPGSTALEQIRSQTTDFSIAVLRSIF